MTILWFSLILLAVIFRCATPHLDGLNNFSPLMAITFCAAIYLPRKIAFFVPFLALFISDLILNSTYQTPYLQPFMLGTYLCYLIAGLVGLWVAQHKSIWTLFGGCLLSTVIFYLITNTLAWFFTPAYTQTFAGWLQALTLGLPGFPPTYTFLRNSLFSDLAFTLLFALCMEWGAAKNGLPSLFPVLKFQDPKANA